MAALLNVNWLELNGAFLAQLLHSQYRFVFLIHRLRIMPFGSVITPNIGFEFRLLIDLTWYKYAVFFCVIGRQP